MRTFESKITPEKAKKLVEFGNAKRLIRREELSRDFARREKARQLRIFEPIYKWAEEEYPDNEHLKGIIKECRTLGPSAAIKTTVGPTQEIATVNAPEGVELSGVYSVPPLQAQDPHTKFTIPIYVRNYSELLGLPLRISDPSKTGTWFEGKGAVVPLKINAEEPKEQVKRRADGSVIPVAGSGTDMLRVMANNVHGDRVDGTPTKSLVIVTGAFSNRWENILTGLGGHVKVIKPMRGKTITAEEIKKEALWGKYDNVFAVAGETSTGLGVDVPLLKKTLAEATETIKKSKPDYKPPLLLLDYITHPFAGDKPLADDYPTAAGVVDQKLLGGVSTGSGAVAMNAAGVAAFKARRDNFPHIASTTDILREWDENINAKGRSHRTLPYTEMAHVNEVFLRVWKLTKSRNEQPYELMRRVKQGVTHACIDGLGLQPYLPDFERSLPNGETPLLKRMHSVVALSLPHGVTATALDNYLRKKYSMSVTGGYVGTSEVVPHDPTDPRPEDQKYIRLAVFTPHMLDPSVYSGGRHRISIFEAIANGLEELTVGAWKPKSMGKVREIVKKMNAAAISNREHLGTDLLPKYAWQRRRLYTPRT